MTDFARDFIFVLPETLMLIMACLVLMAEVFGASRNVGYLLSLTGLLGAAILTFLVSALGPGSAFGGMFIADPMADVLKLVTYLAGMTVVVYSRGYLEARSMLRGEYFALILFATLGMMVMISAGNFLSLYLGLELLSLSLYSMVAVGGLVKGAELTASTGGRTAAPLTVTMQRDAAQASEAAMKYFVLGALASGLLLYGMSLLYGVSGSLDISQVAETLLAQQGGNTMLLTFALVFIIAGMGFKLGVAPFHMWVPDIYEGSRAPVALFIATAPKLAAFAFVMRLLVFGMPAVVSDWQMMLAVMAVLSLAIGNLAAIMQTNLKRMLAYSTISHMGFLLLGVLSASIAGFGAGMFYAVSYVLMSLASFGLIVHLSPADTEADQLDHYRGLNKRHPWMAAMMAIVMFSMAGLPPFLGFYAKFFVLQALVGSGWLWLALVAVLFSLIGAFYYLRVVKIMYFDAPSVEEGASPSGQSTALLSANGLAVLALGLMPQPLLLLCVSAVQSSLS